MANTICAPNSAVLAGFNPRCLARKRTSDINFVRRIGELAINMIDRHVAHDEHKSYPWHERTIHIRGNKVCPS